MEIEKPRLWTRNFIILSLASLFIGLIFYLTVTTITVYVTEEFNASESKAGLASSIMVIGTLSARLQNFLNEKAHCLSCGMIVRSNQACLKTC